MSKPSSSSRFPRPLPPENRFRPPCPSSENRFRRGPPTSENAFGRGPPPPLRYHHHDNNGYGRNPHRDRPNFVIELRSQGLNVTHYKRDIDAVIGKLNSPMENYEVYRTGPVAAALFFAQWVQVLEAVIALWKIRFEKGHDYTPHLVSNVLVPSDQDEMNSRLTALFSEHIKGLVDGDEVRRCLVRVENLNREIERVSNLLKGHNSIAVFIRLDGERKVLIKEKKLVESRIEEFRSAMKCLVEGLEGEKVHDHDVRVFKIGGGFDWRRIFNLIVRECRRLEDGLPIYGFRKEILKHILSEQVIVLIGETGSGKSTQLVQYLADSGLGANQSIICTQPRKIAAMSLAERVRKECQGCYKDSSIICYPTFSSSVNFNSNVVYTTDNCLLQRYMKDKNLSGVSCIVVDEAHERSLNTDLLLALLKGLLSRRFDLRLVIMSATADAKQLSEYFYGCNIFHIVGRNFPVDVKYIPCVSEGTSSNSSVAPYVSDVVRMATEIHKSEEEGTVLAFLTSQIEVEWACERFRSPCAVALPLHGKLSFDEQFRVYQNYQGKRKVIFATNLAETSLTIPGVKYVIDCGLVKESKFEPGSGMNLLRVCRISQSSANQRAGRAGRTEPGQCYRLYAESDFESMSPNQEPEIRRVHLGIAVLRIIALGIRNIQDFDFVDAPTSESIDMATRSLVQLGAIKINNDALELTEEGRLLVKLGVEPRLGKLILSCYYSGLRREGLVLAAVMANSSSIFCRVGDDENKMKADCLKVQFCHRNGDLFTLLSVYKAWEAVPKDRRNRWCWENGVNAKSMRRCHDTVSELEFCLKKELSFIIPSYWLWDPNKTTDHDRSLKNVILSSIPENVAMYSGYDQLGYEVALTGQYVQLHPSCSLWVFGEKPQWVVFGELLSISNQYLVCVTAFDSECLSRLDPAPLFDISSMESRKLRTQVITGLGPTLLRKFCGKSNHHLSSINSRITKSCMDEKVGIDVSVERNEIQLIASKENMNKLSGLIDEVIGYERKWLQNECVEKYLYLGSSISPPVALFGAGAEIKHIELDNRFLTVDVYYLNLNLNAVDDKELLRFIEDYSLGSICAVHRFTGIGQDGNDKEKWGRVTFLSADAAKRAAELYEYEFCGSLLTVCPTCANTVTDHKMFSFPAVRAKVCWPRRPSRGFGIVKCDPNDADILVSDFSNVQIGGNLVQCDLSHKSEDSVVIRGLDRDLSEDDIFDVLRNCTRRKIRDFFLIRGDCVEGPPCDDCQKELIREILRFMPKCNSHLYPCQVQVYPPQPKDTFMRALIMFDGRLHLEAAKALEEIEGTVLPGCLPWQKIKCQRLFHSSISCPAHVYPVIRKQLESLLTRFKRLEGAECNLDRNERGSYRVRISASATKTVAELRKPFEELMQGKTVDHASLSPSHLQLLFSRNGINIIKSVQQETGTYILFDRHNLRIRIFGTPDNIVAAEKKLTQSLLALHESRQLEVCLRGEALPNDLMKEVVNKFGPDLHKLKQKFPGANFTLDVRHHVILINGSIELKQKVQEIVYEVVQNSGSLTGKLNHEVSCPICLCAIEDSFRLESCGHMFCRSCLLEQCESAVRNFDSFPICCSHEDCGAALLLTDLKSLLSSEKLEELFRASLGAFVASSGGIYRFCPSPDCPSVYRVAGPGKDSEPFICGACYAETCTRCHLEYHPYISCERYREYKEDPDLSLKEWCKGKVNVKNCPVCGYTIEKVDGCDHVECKCGRHICWMCLESFGSSDDCYDHLRAMHAAAFYIL